MIAENDRKRYPETMRRVPATVLCRKGISALLVSDLINIRYLTGVEIGAGLALVTRRSIRLFVDARYEENARRSAYPHISVAAMDALVPALGRIRRCGYEEEHVTMARLRRWKRTFKNTKFVQSSGGIEELRRRKDARELRAFRQAQRITRQLITRVPRALVPGITERELAYRLEAWARSLGAEGLSFDPIVAFGTHTSCPHHRPTRRKLRRGHLVQIDIGVRYQGYCADQSAVFFTGMPTQKQRHVLSVLEQAKAAAVCAVRPGVSTHALDRIARAVLRENGLEKYFTHALGHGVGLEIHEGVSLSQRRPSQELLQGEIVTIEPGVYFPGQWGMRLEEEVIVK